MLRKFGVIVSLSFVACYASSQIYDPVSWDFSFEKKGDRQYELIFSASIDENSHIYSMDIPDGGPIPTSFTLGNHLKSQNRLSFLMKHSGLRLKHSAIRLSSVRK
jgi:hypothetical protein